MMNFEKLDVLRGMKHVERFQGTPKHQNYNLLEHQFMVSVMFKWFASVENVSYDINTFMKVLLHDFVEGITTDLINPVKHFNKKTSSAWATIENELCSKKPWLIPYMDDRIKATFTDTQFRLFKCCDLLDLWLFCMDEISLGNKSKKILHTAEYCEHKIKELTGDFSIFKNIKDYMNYVRG